MRRYSVAVPKGRSGERIPIEARPGFDPCKHQMKAFERLYSRTGINRSTRGCRVCDNRKRSVSPNLGACRVTPRSPARGFSRSRNGSARAMRDPWRSLLPIRQREEWMVRA
jgi:hypothetical protein